MQKLLLFVILILTQYSFSQNQEFDIVFKNVNIVTMENDKALLNQNIGFQYSEKAAFSCNCCYIF